jgi:hypothetical protein
METVASKSKSSIRSPSHVLESSTSSIEPQSTTASLLNESSYFEAPVADIVNGRFSPWTPPIHSMSIEIDEGTESLGETPRIINNDEDEIESAHENHKNLQMQNQPGDGTTLKVILEPKSCRTKLRLWDRYI